MGKSLGETGRTMSRVGLRVSGPRREMGLCAAVPGLQGRGRESAVRAFPQAGKPSRRTQAPLSFLTHLSPGTYSGALKTPPPHRGPGSAAAPGTGLDVPAFWELVALPTSHSPRLDGCLWSRHLPSGLYLTSFGSRPVSLRIFSSTFFRLSLAFSSCSCKVLTATAIFSPQQVSRLLHRPRLPVPRRQARGD